MINNQINRRIGSCEEQLNLSLFLVGNREKEKKGGFDREIASARKTKRRKGDEHEEKGRTS